MKTSIDFRYPDMAAIEFVNNWQRFEDFGISDREHFEGYTIVYTHGRDSNLLDKINAEVIAECLSKFAQDVEDFSANHWACGWIAGHAIRVYDADGKLTAAFAEWCKIELELQDYPVLDEDRYSDTLHELTVEYMESEGLDVEDEDAYKLAQTYMSE